MSTIMVPPAGPCGPTIRKIGNLSHQSATGSPDDFKTTLSSDNARLGPFVKELTVKAN